MKILFLDIDGVLNHCNTKQLPQQPLLDKECIANLNFIVQRVPDLKVVLSSAWRTQETLQNNARDLKRFGYKGTLHAQTASLCNSSFQDSLYQRLRRTDPLTPFPTDREFEIYMFLQCLVDNKVVVDNVCVLDDMLCNIPRYPSWFGTYFNRYGISTSRDTGLLGINAQHATHILLKVAYLHTHNMRLAFFMQQERDYKLASTDPDIQWTLEKLYRDSEQQSRRLLT
jgi:hypothetical protein